MTTDQSTVIIAKVIPKQIQRMTSLYVRTASNVFI